MIETGTLDDIPPDFDLLLYYLARQKVWWSGRGEDGLWRQNTIQSFLANDIDMDRQMGQDRFDGPSSSLRKGGKSST